jgi:hypothetical protein
MVAPNAGDDGLRRDLIDPGGPRPVGLAAVLEYSRGPSPTGFHDIDIVEQPLMSIFDPMLREDR